MELIRRWTVLILLAMVVASPLFADAREDYKSGLAALDSGKTARARELLQRAVDQEPQSRKPIIGRSYLPHFYLGKARFELGDCRGALESWHESQRQGAIEKAKDELADLERHKGVCEQQLLEFDAAKQKAQTRIDDATRVSSRVGLLEADDLLAAIWDEGEQSLEKRHEQAVHPLWQAKKKINQAEAAADASIAREAEELASRSIEALEALEVVADQRRRQIESHRNDLTQRLSRAVSGAQRALSQTESNADSIPGINDLRTRLRRLVAAAASEEEKSETEIVSLSDRIVSLTNGLKRATKMPPEELQIAAAAYLAGDYAHALEILDSFESSDNRVVSQICLLRSATLHALERLGLPLPIRPSSEDADAEDGIATELPLEVVSSTVQEPTDGASEEVSIDRSEDIQTVEETVAGNDVITALEVLLACDGLDARIEPGASIFPPSYLELFGEFRRIEAVAALDETP